MLNKLSCTSTIRISKVEEKHKYQYMSLILAPTIDYLPSQLLSTIARTKTPESVDFANTACQSDSKYWQLRYESNWPMRVKVKSMYFVLCILFVCCIFGKHQILWLFCGLSRNRCSYLIFVISSRPANLLNPIILHLKITNNTQILQQIAPKSVKYALFEFNLENLTPDRICLHRHRLWCL